MSTSFFLRVRGVCHFTAGTRYYVSEDFLLSTKTDIEPVEGAEIELQRDDNWRYILTLSSVSRKKNRPFYTAQGDIGVCLDLPGDDNEHSDEYGDRRNTFKRVFPALLREDGYTFEFVR